MWNVRAKKNQNPVGIRGEMASDLDSAATILDIDQFIFGVNVPERALTGLISIKPGGVERLAVGVAYSFYNWLHVVKIITKYM